MLTAIRLRNACVHSIFSASASCSSPTPAEHDQRTSPDTMADGDRAVLNTARLAACSPHSLGPPRNANANQPEPATSPTRSNNFPQPNKNDATLDHPPESNFPSSRPQHQKAEINFLQVNTGTSHWYDVRTADFRPVFLDNGRHVGDARQGSKVFVP